MICFLEEQKSPDYFSVNNNSIIPKSIDNSPCNAEFFTPPKNLINFLIEPKKKENTLNNNKEQLQNTKLIAEKFKKPPLNPSSPKRLKEKEKNESLTFSLPSTIYKEPKISANHKKSQSNCLFTNNFEEVSTCDAAKSLDSKKITSSKSNNQLIQLSKQSNETSEANSFEKKEIKNSQIDQNIINMDPFYQMRPKNDKNSSLKTPNISEQLMVLIGILSY